VKYRLATISGELKMSDTSIARYLEPLIPEIEYHYQWSFNVSTAIDIVGTTFSDCKNWYEKTLRLKSSLRKMLAECSSLEQRVDIADYFIGDWGHVPTNESLTSLIDRFTGLVANGAGSFASVDLNGVSSWSKYISLCCDWAAIYDSRVAYSINAIRYMSGQTDQFFPIPPGRSPRLNLIDIETLFISSRIKAGVFKADHLGHRQFSALAKREFHVAKTETYVRYIDLLKEITAQLGLSANEFFKVEMLLFALAPGRVLFDLVEHIQTH
jgi:hypothetical protein